MGKQEDQLKISKEMEAIIFELDSLDLESVNNSDVLHSYLNKVFKLDILINCFIERYGENHWSNWGAAKLTKVKTLAYPLECKLNQIGRKEISSSKSFTKKMAIVSAIFAAISALAALYNIFYGSGTSG